MTIKAQALATLVINADGYSPTVTTGTSSDGSTTITVTNKDGSTTTELVDGTAREDAANAATSATDYISPQSVSSTDDGIKVFPKSEKDNPRNYISIDSDSTDIYKNGKKIAQYSQGIIINDDDGNKVFSAELMNGKYINEHDSLGIHKKISAGVTTILSFDLIVAPSGDIEGTIPVSNSFGELLGIMNVYSFIEAPQELSIPSEYGTGTVLVNSISYTNKTVTVSITNNTNIEIDFGTSAEYADHMIWSYYMRDYGVATRCGGFWENDYTKAFAIGIGKDTNNRKNAFAVDWDGNTIMQGELAFGTTASAVATRANLGLTGVETKTLLWTNASPASAFTAQTLDSSDGIPDLSGYDAVEIVCRYSTTDDTRIRYICDVGGSSPMYWFYYTATDGKYTGVRSRNVVSASTTGVTFNACSGKPGNSTTNTTNNGYIIPIEIYGVKVV